MQGCDAACMWRIATQPCLPVSYNKMDSSTALDPAVLGSVQQLTQTQRSGLSRASRSILSTTTWPLLRIRRRVLLVGQNGRCCTYERYSRLERLSTIRVDNQQSRWLKRLLLTNTNLQLTIPSLLAFQRHVYHATIASVPP